MSNSLTPTKKNTQLTKKKHTQPTKKKSIPKTVYGTLTPPLFQLQEEEKWLHHLKTEGYVVIENIISDNINGEATKLFTQEWTTVSPQFKWNDTGTWTTTNSPMVWGKSSAMFNGFGQSNFMWFLRTQPTIHQAFEKVFSTKELATSLDGFSVFLSPKQKSPNWLHQDQKAQDTRKSVQGIVNLKPVGKDDAGFVCVPKSHETHKPKPSKTDWVMLDLNDPHYPKAVKLLIPENCLTLWHSKTIHSNIGMSTKHPLKVHLNRLSAYITMAPKSRQTPEIVERRKQGYKHGESCSHWVERHEVKKIPFHLKSRYAKRKFNDLVPKLDGDGNIPDKYAKLI